MGRRTFSDTRDEGWTVEERLTSQPELWFTSSRGERRVVTSYPRHWQGLADEALAKLCEEAVVVEPPGEPAP